MPAVERRRAERDHRDREGRHDDRAHGRPSLAVDVDRTGRSRRSGLGAIRLISAPGIGRIRLGL